MRIVVLVKYVPQVDSNLSLTDSLVTSRDATYGTLNELDEHGVEAALALADMEGQAHEVIALTMAPSIGDLALRKTFQLGVERGIRITDESLAGSDIFGTAEALAAAIRKLGAQAPIDLVIAGMASSDAGGAVVPAVLAAELGWPILSFASSLELAGRALTVTRHIDGVDETLRATLPLVLSVTDSANTVRPPNFKLLVKARTKPIETWSLHDLEVDASVVGAAGSRVRVATGVKVPAKPTPPKVMDDGEGSGAHALVDFLKSHNLINLDSM